MSETTGSKKPYIIKRMHWEGEADVLARLQWLMDWNLRVESELVQAMQRAGTYGNHGGQPHGHAVMAEPRDRQTVSSDCEGASETEASSKEMH